MDDESTPEIGAVKFQEKKEIGRKLVPLNEWFKQASTSEMWLINGYMPYGGITLMSGHSKRAHKTWLADLTALTIATGKTLMEGWEPIGVPTGGAPVVYIEEEGTAPTNKERIIALMNYYNIKEESVAKIFYGFHQYVKLDNPEWVKFIKDQILEIEPALCIFDALTYMHSGDANSEKDIAPMVTALREFRGLSTTVLGLMHLNGSQGEDPKADIDSQFRGSKLVVNAYDSHLALRKYAGNAKGPITFITRQKKMEEKEQGIRWMFDNLPDGTLVGAHAELLEHAEDVQNYLVLLEKNKPYTIAALRKTWPGRSDLERQKICDALVDDGYLTIVDGAYHRVEGDNGKL